MYDVLADIYAFEHMVWRLVYAAEPPHARRSKTLVPTDIYLTTGITSSQFLQHFSELNH